MSDAATNDGKEQFRESCNEYCTRLPGGPISHDQTCELMRESAEARDERDEARRERDDLRAALDRTLRPPTPAEITAEFEQLRRDERTAVPCWSCGYTGDYGQFCANPKCMSRKVRS